MYNPATILVLGNYGELVVHRASGHIVRRTAYDPAENPYADILWIDPETLPDRSWADLVETGAVWADGTRDNPCALVNVDAGFVEWADLPRLSAPPATLQ